MITRDIPTKEHTASVEDKSRPGLEHGVNLVKVKKDLNHHLHNTWHETAVKNPHSQQKLIRCPSLSVTTELMDSSPLCMWNR
jgi:hypothetical protein